MREKQRSGCLTRGLSVFIAVVTLVAAMAAILSYIGVGPDQLTTYFATLRGAHAPTSAGLSGGSSSQSLRLGVVSYFNPGVLWTQVESSGSPVGLAIINPDSGPGSGKDFQYADVVTQARQRGLEVIGYVSTSFAGTQDTSRTLAAAERDVSDYYKWYPTIGGIFIDEVPTDCNAQKSYYQPLYDYIKALQPSSLVVLDPGSSTAECYMSGTDIMVEFDDTYAMYGAWQAAGWETSYPASRFWHIISSANQSEMRQALSLARSRHVGWVYVTDGTAPDPFSSLPSYWSSEVSAVRSM